MQSVVTGQAPITLERKLNLGGKTNKLTLTTTDCARAAGGSSSKIMLRTLRRFLAMQLEHRT